MSSMKPLLIIYRQMHTGGIETLILRFAQYYRSKGFMLHVILTEGGGSLLPDLERAATVRIMNTFPLVISRDFLEKDPFYKDIREVLVLCPEGNTIGLKIASQLYIPYKVGVYHPEDYGLFASRFYRRLFNAVPDECKLFMNDDCLINHERILGRKIHANIWPLPVITEKPEATTAVRIPEKNKMISIGRFDPFKTYNLTTIKTVSKLKAKGLDLKYDMYGYGLLEDQMRELIKNYDLTDSVFLKGMLKYDALEATARKAYLFVGCGTAAIEASHAGVPSIIATLETDGLANGLFTDAIGYNIGEKSSSLKTQTIESLIEYIIGLSDEQYFQLSALHTRVAKERYEAASVFGKYFKLPEITVNLNATLKSEFIKASLYFLAYKTYKKTTKVLGLQKLKKIVRENIKP